MMAGSHGDSLLVEGFSDFFGGAIVEYEGEDADFFASGTDETETGNAEDAFGGVFEESMFIVGDIGEAEAGDVVEGCAESDGVGDIGGAGFELGWGIGIFGLFEGDVADHVAATLPWGEDFVKFFADVGDPDAGGAEDFVS